MPLDPQAQAYLEMMKQLNIHYDTLTPAQAREAIKAMLAARPAGEPVARVEDRTIPGPASEIPIRIYTPQGSGPLPVLVYLHTGAWVLGGLDIQDPLCRRITNRAGCIVVAVDYRLAPEHPFPAAVEDSFAATEWVAAHAAEFGGDPARIAIGGDSAGGNMATVVALMARDQGGPQLVFQLMLFPATDFRLNTPSLERTAPHDSVSKQEMLWIIKQYLPNAADITHPLASPMLAVDLSELPPAFIMTAEYDGLRDEGERYGKRLQEAGVPTRITRYDGMIHDFPDLFEEPGTRAVSEIAAVLRSAFNLDATPATPPDALDAAPVPPADAAPVGPSVAPQPRSGNPFGAMRLLFRRRRGSGPALAPSLESGHQS
jgi:acetyl esterase